MTINTREIPKLSTEAVAALDEVERKLLVNVAEVDAWFEREWQKTTPPIYGSVDLRNAGFKLAPIDMNLFPAGFNNLNPDHLSISVLAAKKTIAALSPDTKNILIIPENHTRNRLYWENVETLQAILREAGFATRLGMLDGDETAKQVKLSSGKQVQLEVIKRLDERLEVDGFTPDLILLNNDLSSGIPEILKKLNQPLIPPAELGWSQRLKSGHFQYYAEVVSEFADQFTLDPWILSPLFRHCGEIDFMKQDGIDCLVANAETLFDAIKQKYAEYHIPHQPFIVVKADAGTYGMAVMTVRNPDELRTLNRKQRTRMATTKGGLSVSRVILQEGVYTFETVGEEQAVAEPVVYLWGDTVVGGFYRVHSERGIDESLNTPGMKFHPLAFAESCQKPCAEKNVHAGENRFYMYGVVAMLSMLAAAREMKG